MAPLRNARWKSIWPENTSANWRVTVSGRRASSEAAYKEEATVPPAMRTLAVKGAEQILRREVNAGVHAELLGRLKTEL